MADKTRKSPVKVPNLGANGIEYIEPQQAQTPQPQNGGLTSVIDQTTGQKIVMPASNMPQGQQQVQPAVQPVVENPYADRAAAQEAVARNSQVSVRQQPNLFAQLKSAGYSSSAQTGQQDQIKIERDHQGNYYTNGVKTPMKVFNPSAVPYIQDGQTQPVLDSNSSSAGMDYLNSLYTSPQEEERLRKASVMNQRILAIGDAIRHIGNIANTVNYAPAQQLNSPVQEEYARYQQGKALRDRANQQFYTYQQQKAAQDAAQRKWEQQFNLNLTNAASQHAYRQEQARIAAENAASQDAYRRGNLARQEAADKARNDLNERKLKQDKWYKGGMLGVANRRAKDQERRTTAYVNRQNGAGGSGVAPLDTPKGQITPNGRSYSNQLLQMFDYAKSKGYVKESDVAKRLREMGFGKDQSDNVKRQMVMDLLRTNQDMGNYASSRLGWSYGSGVGGGMDLGLEDDEDEMDLGLD